MDAKNFCVTDHLLLKIYMSGRRRMEQRHMSNQLMIPVYYQHETNHPPLEQSHIPMVRGVASENVHFVTPMDHSIRGGDHSNSRWDFGGRSNVYHSSNMSMEAQHLPPHLSRPSFDPLTPTSTNGSISLAPFGPVGHIHSTHGISESGGTHKRKTPGVFSSTLYGAESSSSSQMRIQNPAVDHLNQPSYRGSYLSINGQDSIRNVRTRSEPQLEPCWTGARVPNYASQDCQPTTHSTNYSAPVHPVNPVADVTGQEQNIAHGRMFSYHGRISHPDISHPRFETSQFHAGMSSADINASCHNPFIRENLAAFSQNPCVPNVQSTRDGHSYHYQRVTPFYRYNGPNSGLSSTQFPSENLSSRYHAAGGRGGGFSFGRPMVAVERPQPLFNVMDSPDGFGPENLTVEHPSFYHEAMNIADPYQDMRLDIDSMSYEELLALEEKIGYVSHGLSEDGMSKCLWEKIVSSMDQNHDHCPVCLEEYKNGEKIGRIIKCGHEYHVECIKKWMMMKKTCPICKSEC